MLWAPFDVGVHRAAHTHFYFYAMRGTGGREEVEEWEMEGRRVGFLRMHVRVFWGVMERREWKTKTVTPPSFSFPPYHFQVDYMDENEEYFQRQASHRQSRRRFRKINQKGERQTIIDTVDPYPTGKPPIARGYHTVSCTLRNSCVFTLAAVGRCGLQRWLGVALFESISFWTVVQLCFCFTTFVSLSSMALADPGCCDVPCLEEGCEMLLFLQSSSM